MKRKTRITKVVLDLGSRQIELTTDEARELFESLSEFFGEKQTTIPYPVYIERPTRRWWTYPQPYWSTTIGSSTSAFSLKDSTLTYKTGLLSGAGTTGL